MNENKIIIFGAGIDGVNALDFLGYNRVLCFVDNNRSGDVLCGKEVFSVNEMLQKKMKNIIVIASEKYCGDMAAQLRKEGIKRYFIFHEYHRQMMNTLLPFYQLNDKKETVSYNRILRHKKIDKYKNIAILGTNSLLPYLILEIAAQNNFNNIRQIITDDESDKKDYLGIPCVKLSEIYSDIDCLILNKRRNSVKESSVFDMDVMRIDLYDIDDIEPAFVYPELEKYKDIHKGKRIFLIGNGPSLTMDDLDKLAENQEICIGFNKVYRAYDRTKWRANYLGITAPEVMNDIIKRDIHSLRHQRIIMADRHNETADFKRMESIEYMHLKQYEFFPNIPDFSDDLPSGFFLGCSIVYDIGLQLAAYMGAAEVFLLGVDHCMKGSVSEKGNHFIDDYILNEESVKYKDRYFMTDQITKAFEGAEIYSRKHGFRIYNATRGGALEVFERVDFDSLF